MTVRHGLAVGLTALAAVLVALAGTVGLDGPGWVAGIVCGLVTNAVVARGLRRTAHAPGPPDVVTLVRLALACGVAALVADAFVHRPGPGEVTTVVMVSAVALMLDTVDGWVARRTRSSTFGARFDGEADAFLLLVLSVYVAGTHGAWVLAIGAMRYVFAVAGWVLPWMRARLPYRYWRKVVAAVQGIVLVVAAAGVLPGPLVTAALAGALVLLAESFGRDVVWLRHHRWTAPADLPRRVRS